MSKSKNTVKNSSGKESKTDTSTMPLSSVISEHSLIKDVRGFTEALRMSSRRDRPVKDSHVPETKQEKTCDRPPLKPFAWWDQNTSCWRTYQISLMTRMCTKYSAPWPRSGIVFRGIAYRRLSVEQTTKGLGCGYLLPTPKARDGRGFYVVSRRQAKHRIGRKDHWIHCVILCTSLSKGWANPRFSELMMGWPIGWTDLKPLEKDKFQSWLKLHGKP